MEIQLIETVKKTDEEIKDKREGEERERLGDKCESAVELNSRKG